MTGAEPPPVRPGPPASKPGRPWWGWIFFFLAPPGEVEARHWRLLGVIGATFLLNQYDLALMGLALPQIQEGLAVPETELGRMLAVVRLGLLPALGLAMLADRLGRLRLLLATVIGFAVCTAATAFAQTPEQFMALQLGARAFITAEEMIAIVVIAEELPPRARGWGFGILAALGALGHGLASLAFGFVDVLPYGWRALYAVGAVPILLVAWVRRGIRETTTFTEAQRDTDTAFGLREALAPLRDAARRYPRRLALFLAAVVPFGFAILTALAFDSKFLQDERGWEPGDVTLLFIGGGVFALAGYAVGGRLADRWGRRRTLCGALLLSAVAHLVFFTSEGPLMVVAWILAMGGFMASDVLFGALSVELFPTSYRATASGLRSVASMVGAVAGLALEGVLYAHYGSHGGALIMMLPAVVISVALVWFALPETAARPLSEIAPDEPGASPHGSPGSGPAPAPERSKEGVT